jgi:hypothetical protein
MKGGRAAVYGCRDTVHVSVHVHSMLLGFSSSSGVSMGWIAGTSCVMRLYFFATKKWCTPFCTQARHVGLFLLATSGLPRSRVTPMTS